MNTFARRCVKKQSAEIRLSGGVDRATDKKTNVPAKGALLGRFVTAVCLFVTGDSNLRNPGEPPEFWGRRGGQELEQTTKRIKLRNWGKG